MAAIDRRLPWRVPWYLWVVFGLAGLGAIHVKDPSLLHGGTLILVIAGLVALLLVAAILWELPPAVMVCAGIALTMFSGNWQKIGLPGFPFVPDRILLVVALLAFILRSPGAADLPRLRLKGVHLLLLAMVLYVTASAVLDGLIGNRSAVFALLDRLGAIPFLIFMVSPAIFPGPRERNWLLATLVGTGAYLGLTAVFESIGPHALVFPHYIRALDIGRDSRQATGPFSAVVTEGFANYASAIAATIAFFQWRGRWRVIAGAVVVVCLLGSFLALERGVWIGCVAGAVAVALFAPEVRRRLIPAAAVCAVAVIGLLALVPSIGAATNNRVSSKLPVWDRQNQDAAALRMVEAKPLFGFGWDNYVNVATPYFRLSPNYPLVGYPSSINGQAISNTGAVINKVTGQTVPVGLASLSLGLHNTYLDYAVELGLVGASLWLACVLFGLGGAIFTRGSPELRPWRLGLLALTVCFFVVAAVDPLDQNYLELLLWTWAGVIVGGRAAPLRSPR